MRISVGAKLVVTYLLVAGGFLLAALFGVTGQQDLADHVQVLVEKDLQRTVTLREVKSTLTHLQGSLQIAPGNPRGNQILRESRREVERALRGLERAAPELATQVTPLYEAYLKSVLEEPQDSPAFGLQRIPYGRLIDQVDDLLYEVESSFRTRQSQVRNLPTTELYNLILIFLGFFLTGLLAFSWFGMRLMSGLQQLRSGMDAVSQGNYEIQLPAMAGDELGGLVRDFNQMSGRLKATRQMFLDASPLTYLPGNIAIERALMDRLRNNEIFALCYIDLDDFKPYNDHYGYARGSEVIKATADIIHDVQRERGSERDFVGHIGGDDFVLVTSMDKVEPICTGIIEAFDAMIPEHYSEEDRTKGHITAKDRFGQRRQFPLMTISLAVVTNASREVSNPVEIAKIAAEIKEYVKLLPGSNYLVDRRTSPR